MHVALAVNVPNNEVDSVAEISTDSVQARGAGKVPNDVVHCVNQFIFSAFGGSGFSTLLSIRRLLAFRRARLSTLLYKSIKRVCLLDFEITNVEGKAMVSKERHK